MPTFCILSTLFVSLLQSVFNYNQTLVGMLFALKYDIRVFKKKILNVFLCLICFGDPIITIINETETSIT